MGEMKINLLGTEIDNPIIPASGTFGFGYEFAEFYDIKHVLLLGRVTSGKGGDLVLETAKKVLAEEFPEFSNFHLEMPDESNRRVGQSIAAASLPKI